jgi:hypothetical protein
MEYSCVGLNDLPDEVLMIIFKKLNNREVLYSLQGVNQRLNKIVQDSTFTSRLTFVKWCSDNFIDVFRCDMMLNRFCLQVLPEIHDKIKWLDLESSSMKSVLRAADYPNLYGLGLYNIDGESARCLFTGKKFQLICFYSKQMKDFSNLLVQMISSLNEYTDIIFIDFFLTNIVYMFR